MKPILIIFYISSLLISGNYASLEAAQPQSLVPNSQFIVPQMVFHIHSNANAESSAEQLVKTETTTSQQLLASLGNSSFKQPDVAGIYNAITAYLKQHWFFCGLITLSALYTALLAYLLYAHYAFHELNYWSCWRSNETFELLMQHSHEELKTTLIKDIATHYINPQNPTDALWPLTRFLEAVKKEETQLKTYITFGAYIKRTPLLKVLPTIQDEYARNALTRLQFVYHLFTAWSADLTWEKLTHSC